MKRKIQSISTKNKIIKSYKRREMPDSWKENVVKAIIKRCAKAVYCHETGDQFESISSAARHLGVAPIQVSRVCRGIRSVVHGVTFKFCDDV